MDEKCEFIELLEELDSKLGKYLENPDLIEDSIIDLPHFEKSRSALSDVLYAVREDILNREQPSLIISRLINEWYPDDVQDVLRKVNVFYRNHYKIKQ